MKRARKVDSRVERLKELKADLALCRDAMRDIVSGRRKQSYGVGTRNAAAYAMSLGDLRAWEKALLKEIEELEAELDGRPLRIRYKFRPNW